MNKQKFLNQLKHELRRMKKQERNKYIEYYDEMISDMTESGLSEADAVRRQGSAKQIAKDILDNAAPASLHKKDLYGTILIILSGVLLICSVAALIKTASLHGPLSTSVIIGGADGPTSVFLAGKIGTPWGLYAATAVMLTVTVIYFVRKRRHER